MILLHSQGARTLAFFIPRMYQPRNRIFRIAIREHSQNRESLATCSIQQLHLLSFLAMLLCSGLAFPPSGFVLALKASLTAFLFISITKVLLLGEHIVRESHQIPRSQHKAFNLVLHGQSRCFAPAPNNLIASSVLFRSSCRKYAPFEKLASEPIRIGMATALFGDTPDHYQKAIQAHYLYALIHNNPLHVLCDPVIDSLWNKPAFILSLILEELQRPHSQRLEWLLWVDADTLLLDPCRPISTFLPSSPRIVGNETNLIISNDPIAFNNGVFLLRVCDWSVNLFAAIVAFRTLRPDIKLWSSDQAAMEFLVKHDQFGSNMKIVPQYWFNAYPKGNAIDFKERTDEDIRIMTEINEMQDFQTRRGDFLVHFAGHKDKRGAILEWLEMLDEMGNVWEGDGKRVQRDITEEVLKFWKARGY